MKRHLLFAFLLLVAFIVSIASFIPVLMGDCGASGIRKGQIEACVAAQHREVSLFAALWLLTLINLIGQHARNSRWQFISYFAFVTLPIVGTLILAEAQAPFWQSSVQSD